MQTNPSARSRTFILEVQGRGGEGDVTQGMVMLPRGR